MVRSFLCNVLPKKCKYVLCVGEIQTQLKMEHGEVYVGKLHVTVFQGLCTVRRPSCWLAREADWFVSSATVVCFQYLCMHARSSALLFLLLYSISDSLGSRGASAPKRTLPFTAAKQMRAISWSRSSAGTMLKEE